MNNRLTVLTAIILGLGCSSTLPKNQIQDGQTTAKDERTAYQARLMPQASAIDIADSEMDIAYSLGDNSYRFTAQERQGLVSGKTFMDKQVLKVSTIDPKRYSEFIQKVNRFLREEKHNLARNPAAHNAQCRNPFAIRLKLKEGNFARRGCRSSEKDGPELSRLVREAEFLLYSKK